MFKHFKLPTKECPRIFKLVNTLSFQSLARLPWTSYQLTERHDLHVELPHPDQVVAQVVRSGKGKWLGEDQVALFQLNGQITFAV